MKKALQISVHYKVFGQTTENDDLCIKFHQMTYGIYTGETK